MRQIALIRWLLTFVIMAVLPATHLSAAAPGEFDVTVSDLLNKVYGVAPTDLTPAEMAACVSEDISLVPESEDGDMWLDYDNGYMPAYRGMKPLVMAVARYEGTALSGYGYFFLFPYPPHGREAAVSRQAEFCGCMLQELYDMGLNPGRDRMAEATEGTLFACCCRNGDDTVDVSLREETADSGGQFILALYIRTP